jgi:hypothetical protein
MAERVVDALEMVYIEENEGDRLPEPFAAAQFRINNAVEMSPVPGASQSICRTEPLQLDNAFAQLVQLAAGHVIRGFIDNQQNAVLDSDGLDQCIKLATLQASQSYPLPQRAWIADEATQFRCVKTRRIEDPGEAVIQKLDPALLVKQCKGQRKLRDQSLQCRFVQSRRIVQ